MKFLSSILLLILSFNAFGQINIFIEDETNSSFLIGIDGFTQNEQPKTQILIKGLDTSSHLVQLRLQSDPIDEFSRKLKLTSKGNYRYVIVKNFRGKPQLRYRGKQTQIPASISAISFNKEIEWIYGNVKKDSITIVDTNVVAISDTLIKTEKPDTNVVVVAKDTATAVIATIIDTIKNPEPDTLIVLSKPKDSISTTLTDTIDPFKKLISEMNSAEFEFNRLNLAKNHLLTNSITVEEIASIFKVFNYDNTRMQFLSFAVARLTDQEKIKELESSFDYELSKDQFKTKYLK